MQSLNLVLSNRGEEGDPLPTVFTLLEELKIRFRRGQLSLIAAAPGGGKSSLVGHLAVHMHVPTLYFSADCDALTIASNILAGTMDITLDEADYLIGEEDPDAAEAFSTATDHIWWNFKSQPTLEDIQTEVLAYAYVFGEYPQLIVLDNLINVNEPGEEYRRYNDIMPWLADLARQTGAHIMILHHVTGEYQNGDRPIPRTGIKHKISEHPRLVLTLYRPEEGVLGIRVVKNTRGPSDTKGELGIDIAWLAERSFFSDG